MQLFQAILSCEGRQIADVFGVRKERPGEYYTELLVDAKSLPSGVIRAIEEDSRRIAADMSAQPWRAFAFRFNGGRTLETGYFGAEPDGFLYFSRPGEFIGPPCPMTNERYYRLNHPSVRPPKRPLRETFRETLPYPDLPEGSSTWTANSPLWREAFRFQGMRGERCDSSA